MGLRRVEAEIDLKSPPQKLYNIWKKTPHRVPHMTPKNIQANEHHDGPWDDHGHGSHKTWNYTLQGKAEVFKERIELDDANLKARHVGLDGDVFKIYKSYAITFQYSPKGTGSLGKITIEYEKLSDDVPDAINYLNFLVECNRDSDEHLVAKA
ncbi:MLP-like protein 328 [Rutidosis leptorrhynchoides]|uniref:MLP-like protein 328 n=1 Tax=Rutidosis leptorrhynchoides TaxID=125765 RepID=UPI003A995F28